MMTVHPSLPKFMGKVDDLQLFLADLKNQAKMCHWDHPTHGILNFPVAGTTFHLLDDYGKLMSDQIQVAWTARTDSRALQNVQMMCECLMVSITDEAKSALALSDLDFYEDGPKLFFHIVNQLFMATFSNAQATRDQLSDFHPKRLKYNIIQINNYVCLAIKMLKAASTAGGTITDQEILYFQFKIYKKIKALAEWATHMLFIEAQVASTPTYVLDTLFKSTYMTLLNQGLWHLSDKMPEEQTLAMVAQQQQQNEKQESPKPCLIKTPKMLIKKRKHLCLCKTKAN